MSTTHDSSGRGPLEAADALCEVLRGLQVEHVFGLPGTQNMAFTEALRRSPVSWIVPGNELAATFAANGYWRSSGRPGVVNAIPGPGFTWALTGLAEARLDSAAVLLLTGARPPDARTPALQEIPQERIARPVVKESFRISSAEEIADTVGRAHAVTVEGEPGPVLVEIDHPVWDESCRPPERASGAETTARASAAGPTRGEGTAEGDTGMDGSESVEAMKSRLGAAARPVLFAGQGAQDHAEETRELAEALGSPVLLTTSGRGVLPESHPLALPLDRLAEPLEGANQLLEASDLVLVLGCRLGHNATLGHRLELTEEKLLRVDASARVLDEGPYRGSVEVVGDVGGVVRALLSDEALDGHGGGGSWHEGRHGGSELRLAGQEEDPGTADEPRVEGIGSMPELFRALRRVLPEDGILVTDSGLHQMMARRYHAVEAPRTLVVPTNFQSMGYGLPAAIGASLANPGRKVVALIGDGGLRMSAFDLSTARELGVDLGVVVFADGHFGLIREGQLDAYGHGSGVDLPGIDLEGLCASLSVGHEVLGADDPTGALRRCVREPETRVLEVRVSDRAGRRLRTARARIRESVRRGLGPEGVDRVKEWIEGWRRRVEGPDGER